MQVISSFQYPDGGGHTPLSNFYRHPIELDGLTWTTNEHYYQAAKAKTPADRDKIRFADTAGEAKRMGRKVELRDDWEAVKFQVMRDALEAKFQPGEQLGDWLLSTAPAMLVEGNTWHDRVWGVCTCERCGSTGDNWLGFMLMARRAELRARLT